MEIVEISEGSKNAGLAQNDLERFTSAMGEWRIKPYMTMSVTFAVRTPPPEVAATTIA